MLSLSLKYIISYFTIISIFMYCICSVIILIILSSFRYYLGIKVSFLTICFLFLQSVKICILINYPGFYLDIINNLDIIKYLDLPDTYTDSYIINIINFLIGFLHIGPFLYYLLPLLPKNSIVFGKQPVMVGGDDTSGLNCKKSNGFKPLVSNLFMAPNSNRNHNWMDTVMGTNQSEVPWLPDGNKLWYTDTNGHIRLSNEVPHRYIPGGNNDVGRRVLIEFLESRQPGPLNQGIVSCRSAFWVDMLIHESPSNYLRLK